MSTVGAVESERGDAGQGERARQRHKQRGAGFTCFIVAISCARSTLDIGVLKT